jgi:hypothetical protein
MIFTRVAAIYPGHNSLNNDWLNPKEKAEESWSGGIPSQ